MASLAGRDKSSTTGINLANIHAETGLNPMTVSPTKIRAALDEREEPVPTRDLWRIPLLEKLLSQKCDMNVHCEKTDAINSLIENLCIS